MYCTSHGFHHDDCCSRIPVICSALTKDAVEAIKTTIVDGRRGNRSGVGIFSTWVPLSWFGHDSVVDAPDVAQDSMKPLQLLVGEGKNAKYIQGILILQTSKFPSDSAEFLSCFRPLQPAQSCSWEDKVCVVPLQLCLSRSLFAAKFSSCLSSSKMAAQLPVLGLKKHPFLVQTLSLHDLYTTLCSLQDFTTWKASRN